MTTQLEMPLDGVDHISYSQVMVYQRCPRLWALTRLYGHKQPATDAMLLGSAVHEALHRHYLACMDGADPLDVIKYIWSAVNITWDGMERPLPLNRYDSGLEMLKRAWLYGDLDYSSTIGAEYEFRVMMGAAPVVGRIDRIDEMASGAYVLTDYKTGMQYPTEELLAEDLELAIYATVWREILQTRNTRIFGAIHNLRMGVTVYHEYSDDQLDTTRQYVEDTWHRIQNDHICAPAPGEACLQYGGCWAASDCPRQGITGFQWNDTSIDLPTIDHDTLYRAYVTMETWLPKVRKFIRDKIASQGELSISEGKERVTLSQTTRKTENKQAVNDFWEMFKEYVAPQDATKMDARRLEKTQQFVAQAIRDADIPLDRQDFLLENLDALCENMYTEKPSAPKIVLEKGE
jgi:RecB family exonuclease